MQMVIHANHVTLLHQIAIIQLQGLAAGHVMQITILLAINVSLTLKTVE